MKLKYYLRGLGIGIIVTTIILMVSFSGRKEEMSDEEVIARAKQLGMVMQEEPSDAADDTQQTSEDGADAQDGGDDTQGADAAPGGADDAQQASEGGALSAEELLAQTRNNADADTDDATAAGSDEGAAQQNTDNDAAGDDGTVPASNLEGSFRLTIQKGDVCRVVCEKLAEGGVITDAEVLRKYLFEIDYASNMSVGEYDIPYGSTNEEIASILQEGPIE